LMEAVRSSETLVVIRATQCNIPEDGILHSHRREHLKSYIFTPGRLLVLISLTGWMELRAVCGWNVEVNWKIQWALLACSITASRTRRIGGWIAGGKQTGTLWCISSWTLLPGEHLMFQIDLRHKLSCQ
jgi:hypothetical protein